MILFNSFILILTICFNCTVLGQDIPVINNGDYIDLNVDVSQLEYKYHYPGYSDGDNSDFTKHPLEECIQIKFSEDVIDDNVEYFLRDIKIFDGVDILFSEGEKKLFAEDRYINELKAKKLKNDIYVFMLKDLGVYVTGLSIKTTNMMSFKKLLSRTGSAEVEVKLTRQCSL